MSLMTQLSLTVVRYAVSGACKIAGLPTGGEQAAEFLISRFSDPSQRLSVAATTATDRAWKTLELTLAGVSNWDRIFKLAEDRAFAEEFRLALVIVKYDDSVVDKGEFFRACLTELRAARTTTALSGSLEADELRRHQRAMAGYAAPTLVAAEWFAAGAMADECERLGYTNLAKFLRFRVRVDDDELPFLTVAVRYYFRQAVTADDDLSREWVFAKLEAIGSTQEQQFTKLSGTLDRHVARLEGMLAGVVVVTEETRQGVDRLEVGQQKSAGLLEDIRHELVEMRRIFGLTGREVRPADASRIQQQADARRVGEMSTRVRTLPEEARRRHPELVLAAAHLDYAAGNQDQAIAGFQAAAALVDDAEAQAEAHYNAYRAALERHAGRKVKSPDDYDLALRELMDAARLAPARYTPFDLHEYLPKGILGHGGFGVTIHCHEVNADRDVAIKVLLADDLERKIEDVIQEGRILAKIRHDNVVELKAVRFADPVKKARPYFVMEYLEGFTTLADRVQQQGPLELRDMVMIAPQIAEGLKAAHDKGVFHRDVKPANVMVRKGPGGWQTKIIDFGLALKRETVETVAGASTSHHRQTTIGNSIAGTVDYAAPEQMGKLPGTLIGPYSDVYGWGKTVCYALFKTPTPGSRHFKEQSVPETLRELLEACLDDEPPHRPQTFAEVLRRLADFAGAMNPPLAPIAEPQTVARPVKWFYFHKDKECGPVSEEELKGLFLSGTITPDQEVWHKGMDDWLPARKVQDLVPKGASSGVRVKFVWPRHEMKNWLDRQGKHVYERNGLKVYVDGKFKAEGNQLEGLDLTFEVGQGKHDVEVVWLDGGREVDRKTFKLKLLRQGDYEVRFVFLAKSGFLSRSMQESTLEVLKEPD